MRTCLTLQALFSDVFKLGASMSRSQWSLPESEIVFCNFGQLYKLSPVALTTWCQILEQVPGAVLWLLGCETIAYCLPRLTFVPASFPEAAVENVIMEFEARGVSQSRLAFAPFADKRTYLARSTLCDLYLDTFEYSRCALTRADALFVILAGSGATGVDALFAGVPIVALSGDRIVARMSSSLLHAVGLHELVG